MKAILLLLVIFIFACQPVQAKDYTVKYSKSSGEIILWGAVYDVETEPGEEILTTDIEAVPISDYIVDKGKVREKIAAEKQADKDKKAQEKLERKQRKQNVLTKLGLNKNDIKALVELIEDKDDE